MMMIGCRVVLRKNWKRRAIRLEGRNLLAYGINAGRL